MLQSPPVEQGWRAVVSDLRERIETGSLPAGSRLPSLAAMAEARGLSIHEVRKAIDRLKSSGHVTGWQGRGNFVSEDRFVYTLARRTRFSVNLSGEGRTTRLNMVGKRRQAAPANIARAFGVKTGTRVQRAEFIRLVQGRPAMVARHFYPLSSRFSGILDHIDTEGGVTAALRACGVEDFFRIETTIMTRLPGPHEALLLDIPSSQPVLVTTGVNVDDEGMPVEVSEAVSRGDRILLRT
ncbi:phosphonate metabolism transcriptional regulator PhnF [Labrenzia sp. 011]|uniref:phosphonate metabolism transcriptional regulator PhnF n=1 Tax=Labrenzia sp. 011 TaxID=2171494 RepID=UPI0014022324|nr:phosphonate metabolism transcriptional regulator PhnF [Labrenzia sp. 011]